MKLFPQVQEGGTNQRGEGVGLWDYPLKIKQLCLWERCSSLYQGFVISHQFPLLLEISKEYE